MAHKNKDELQSQIHYRLIEELSASETRYRELVELLQDVVFECDEQGRLTFLNRAWHEILGYSNEDSLNKPITDFVHPLSGYLDSTRSQLTNRQKFKTAKTQ